MKPTPRLLPALFLTLLTAAAHAGPRSSTNYSIPTDTTDAGGKRATSASYTHDGSVGGVVGISTVATPAETAKNGYLGQLTEVTALQLAAAPTRVNETATLGLTVLDSIPDNFGSYAGDNLADDWQFGHFGLDNPLAAPNLDPDGDGQNNAFEEIAGLVPTDPLSRFLITISPVPGQATQKRVVFDPVVAGRSYTVKTSPDLAAASWTTLAGSTSSDNGSQRTVTDTSASETKKFYTVEIVKP
jgi:hypothetical protein